MSFLSKLFSSDIDQHSVYISSSSEIVVHMEVFECCNATRGDSSRFEVGWLFFFFFDSVKYLFFGPELNIVHFFSLQSELSVDTSLGSP